MSSGMKSLIFIGDGMGGRPMAELDSETTVEAANTPAMDRIAREGSCGLLDPIAPGRPAGSDTSHMALMGYQPEKHYRGRGPFEAKGVGIDIKPGDVAFRCNFATVEGKKVVDRRAGRIKSGTDELAEAIQQEIPKIEDVQIIFEPSVEHRAAMVLRGPGLSHEISEVDPHDPDVDYLESKALESAEDVAGANKTARILNEFVKRAHEVLDDHPINQERRENDQFPANIVLPRGAGTAVDLEPFEQRYGLKGAMIVEVDLVRGVGEYLEMDVIRVDGATGGQDTDEMAIARAIVEAFETNDFVLANIKCPDLGGHDGDCEAKIAAIEKVDRAIGYLLDTLDWDRTTIMVTADHCTPCALMDHSGDAVPLAFFGYGTRPDDVERYGERPCAKGIMGHLRGMEIMDVLLNMGGRAEKFGA
ncbi:MAG: 2,3-bisphosphoglycerate-independent phosphoglycerate mutase [Armatimonadota bacterium]